MLKKELAEQLGLSASMVSRLAKKGMPTDSVDRAERWRRRHLEPAMVKGTRAGTERTLRPVAPMAKGEQLATAAALSALAREADQAVRTGDFARIEARVREALRQVPLTTSHLPAGALPRFTLGVWLGLVGYYLHPDAEIRSGTFDGELSCEEFGMLVNRRAGMGFQWHEAACDWDDVTLNGWGEEAVEPA